MNQRGWAAGSGPSVFCRAGNPARRIGWMCFCGARLNEALTCPACGLVYELVDEGLAEA